MADEFKVFLVDFSDYDRLTSPREDFDPETQEPVDDGWQPIDPWEFERLVEKSLTMMMARETAQIRLAAYKAGKVQAPDEVTQNFLDLMGKDLPDQLFTIERLWPRNGNVLLAAEAKTGKSTLVANLIRALADGGSFLNNLDFPVVQVPKGKTIALLDLEMNERRIKDELVAQRIQHPEKLLVSVLRGQSQSFNFLSDEVRASWVKHFKDNNVHTLIIDPIAPLLAQLGVDENDNFGVAQLFNLLDKMKSEAGITDMIVVHHTGHNADHRPRGASRFKDWPDAIWMMVKDGDGNDPDVPRIMRAIGRDVGLVVPGRLILDRDTKRLTFEDMPDGERTDASANRRDALQAYLYGCGANGSSVPEAERDRQENPDSQVPPCSTNTLRTAFRGLAPVVCEHDNRFYHNDLCTAEH